jgi:hypothetical protein
LLITSRICLAGFVSNDFQELIVENLFSVKESARKLGGISPWTVYSWLSQGKLQRTKVGGRTMIRESELARVIRDGEKSPEPPAHGEKNTPSGAGSER